MGLCGYPDGKRYYEYLAASSTGTGYTVPELKQQVQVHMSEDLAQVTLLLQNHPELAEASASYSFAQTEPAAILDALKTQAEKDFSGSSRSGLHGSPGPQGVRSLLKPRFLSDSSH